MKPEFRHRVTGVLATHYGIPAEALDQPGTTLHQVEPDAWDDWFELIPVGAQIGIEVPPAHRDAVQALVSAYPRNHTLTGSDFTAAWGPGGAKVDHMKVYMLDPAGFIPFTPDARYTVRALTAADQAAFDAFQARCSQHDRIESDISLEQEAPYGVFESDRIVAGASTYMWQGLVDIGVLTDPDYRQQGLGKAAVSAVCAHFLQAGDNRILCYRHGIANRGSQGVAEGVGFSLYATVEAVARTGG